MEERHGFIHEKIEIKILILFILSRLPAPINGNDLAELALCDGGFDYFTYAECLAELVESDHITLNDNEYAITDKGRTNCEITLQTIPYSVRVSAGASADEYADQQRRNALIQSSHTVRPRGDCDVQLSMSDGSADMISMKILVGSESEALEIEKRFRRNAEAVYMKIIELLLSDESEK